MGAIIKFKRIHTDDDDINQMQQSLKATLDSITQNIVLSGNLLQGVALKSGNNNVGHGLGRNWVTYLIGNLSAAATIVTAVSSDPSTILSLTVSAPCTADILVL